MNLKKSSETQFEFMAIMPNENLSAYVENITMEQINEIDQKLIRTIDVHDPVYVDIPKFEFEYILGLKNDLKKLGIK